MKNDNYNNTQNQQGNMQRFNIQRIYLKDLSIEIPNAPDIFLDMDKYKVDVNIKVGGKKIADNIFESDITLTVNALILEKILYIIEITQSGIFEFINIDKPTIDKMLSVTCYTIIYPYLRTNLADILSRMSMPTFHLEEVNFQALYEQYTND
ncbi:preprotein translocase subunit SecB [Candidatus Kinetoplastibacterium blastocrithidii TCC012E]|uniref:Preprotein translocase subunit SecB n=1 Tax=Candidatus Kinetoplastidibacterium blastocrithidiae TCC012E TaxID=1208922 RepID=M1M1A4_9PROT|nr:protein-export chaperone SecB [Candidatus Kinetoplastibacterium blastocrithidii]AFZ83241.1 preprotein translocase subunit SecB [Candidatus Kinetoplastibacterium blastocrithidii (ex Strigomonas culicis)]AGF50056.1 preprotein translocase subunit SecB [Candidatus Kinetoplastibacterium blastocrithidii TCC012E]